MRPDLLLAHTELSRRAALGLAGKAAATTALTDAGLAATSRTAQARNRLARRDERAYDDALFDVAAAEAGGWAPTRYGREAQLSHVQRGHPAQDGRGPEAARQWAPYQDLQPRRADDQRLPGLPHRPAPRLGAAADAGGGMLQGSAPIGPNRVSIHEERFPKD